MERRSPSRKLPLFFMLPRMESLPPAPRKAKITQHVILKKEWQHFKYAMPRNDQKKQTIQCIVIKCGQRCTQTQLSGEKKQLLLLPEVGVRGMESVSALWLSADRPDTCVKIVQMGKIWKERQRNVQQTTTVTHGTGSTSFITTTLDSRHKISRIHTLQSKRNNIYQ